MIKLKLLCLVIILISSVNLLAEVTTTTLTSNYDSTLNSLSFNIESTGTVADCYYTLYSAKNSSYLTNNLNKAIILADRELDSLNETLELSGIPKLNKSLSNKNIFFKVVTQCGLELVSSNITSINLKSSKNGLAGKSLWQKRILAKLKTNNTSIDQIRTTCSVNDQFELEELSTVFDHNNVGVSFGASIADSSSILLSDGTVRKYFFANGAGLKTATSTDGITFTVETGAVIPEGQAAHNKIFKLSSNNYKLFTTSSILGGIISYSTTNLTDFTLDSGVRVTESNADLNPLSHLSIVPTKEGKYRGYFSNLPIPDVSPLEERTIKSALSENLSDWDVESGIRLGFGGNSLNEPSEQPHALQRGQGCVTLFYFKALSDSDGYGLYYSTSKNGTKFTKEFFSGIIGNGPDILRLSDRSYLLYYDTGNNEDGFSIKVARLTLNN